MIVCFALVCNHNYDFRAVGKYEARTSLRQQDNARRRVCPLKRVKIREDWPCHVLSVKQTLYHDVCHVLIID